MQTGRGVLAITLSILLALPSIKASGAQGDALEALVAQAMAHNPGLESLKASSDAARRRVPQARALPDPRAELEFMNLSVDRFSGRDALNRGVSLGVVQPLPYPGKRDLSGKMAQSEAQVEASRIRIAEARLRADVTQAAFRLASLGDLLNLNGRKREALSGAEKSAEALYASGMGTQADILLAQSALTRNDAERIDLETRRSIAMARLESLLGGPADPATLAAVSLPDPSPLPPSGTLLESLPESSPEVALADATVDEATAGIAVARRASRPDFSVGLRYRRNDMTMGGGDFLTASVGMTLPFFHRRDRYEPAVEEALDRQRGAASARQNALVTARYRLMEAYEEGRRSYGVFGLYRDGLLMQARQAYESALASYSVGRADFSTLLQSLIDLYQTEAQVTLAREDFGAASAELEAALGTALPPPATATEDPAKETGP